MFIAILDICTNPDDRANALAQLMGEQPEVRAMPGCIGFRVFASSEDDRRLTVLHEWTDQASFATYTASDAFTRSGEVIFPLLVEPPVSRRFSAELVETVN